MDETVRAIVAAGGSAQAVQCEVTVEAMVQAAVAVAAGDEGQLDIAVKQGGLRRVGLDAER